MQRIKALPLQDSLSRPPYEITASSLYTITHVDAFEWLQSAAMNSIHAIVTDPPYGLVEYSEKELLKLKQRKGGIWRLPPAFDGHKRMPLPRFTVLTERDQKGLQDFFHSFAYLAKCVLVPGGHIFIATNPLVSHLVYGSFLKVGFEKRAEIIRTVYTLRGGDRPKNAHDEFADVTVMPKSCWEPWGLFRKPCEGRVQDNLRKWGTGGLKRISPLEPFKDLIQSSPARKREREIAPHPSLKPQNFLRQIVRASLLLDKGVILDPFMGSGSTVGAATACGLSSIDLEVRQEYFQMAQAAIPKLAVYQRKDVKLIGGKAVPRNGD